MESQFLLVNVREFLGPTSDPQLRLVSRFCRDELATTPVEALKIKDYVSSVPLMSWAWRELNMPRTNLVTDQAARDGQVEVLQWLRALTLSLGRLDLCTGCGKWSLACAAVDASPGSSLPME
jgi:hypothetical protein